MGTICPCGVQVDAMAKRQEVWFNECKSSIRGNLTYAADVCVTTLATSTLSLRFEDTETPNRNSFLFTANAITNVTCRRETGNCVVTVTGTGLIGNTQYPFVAVYRDQDAFAANDSVLSFVITGFFDQTGAVKVAQGSIVALGCQSV